MHLHKLIFLSALCFSSSVAAQDKYLNRISTNTEAPSPQPGITEYANEISKKTSRVSKKLSRANENILSMFSKQEAKILTSLRNSDSAKNADLIKVLDARHSDAVAILKDPSLLNRKYMSYLDSTLVLLKLVGIGDGMSSNNAGSSRVAMAIAKTNILQEQINKSSALLDHLKDSKNLISGRLMNRANPRTIMRMKKSVFQYNQRLDEYAGLLNNKKQVEEKLIRAVTKTKQFKDFMTRNSVLASMFSIPTGGEEGKNTVVAEGLQTRSAVDAGIRERLGAKSKQSKGNIGGPFDNGRSKLGELKTKLILNSAGNEGDAVPEPIQRSLGSKSVGKRIVFDINFQTHRTPVIAMDIGLGIGYLLNDRSIVGIGGAYKAGLGKSIQNISISHEGISLRSFLDWRVKNGIWISGGYERNFLSEIKKLDMLKDRSAWQHSGLLGITKKIQHASGLLKSTKFQLLWDFLSYQQVPRAQPLVFRLGYGFK